MQRVFPSEAFQDSPPQPGRFTPATIAAPGSRPIGELAQLVLAKYGIDPTFAPTQRNTRLAATR